MTTHARSNSRFRPEFVLYGRSARLLERKTQQVAGKELGSAERIEAERKLARLRIRVARIQDEITVKLAARLGKRHAA